MLTRGGMVVLYGADAASTLQSLNLFAIQNMATSPHGLGEYLQFFESQPSFHCNFDHILVAGGQLTQKLAERAWARMCPELISLMAQLRSVRSRRRIAGRSPMFQALSDMSCPTGMRRSSINPGKPFAGNGRNCACSH